MAKQDFPRWMYGPGGKSQIFNRDDQIPSGWQDHPDKVRKQGRKPQDTPAAGAEPSEEERQETIRQLREAGADISDDASIEEINTAIDEMTKSEEVK